MIGASATSEKEYLYGQRGNCHFCKEPNSHIHNGEFFYCHDCWETEEPEAVERFYMGYCDEKNNRKTIECARFNFNL